MEDDGTFNYFFYQDFEHHNAPIEYTTKLWSPDWNDTGWRDGDYRTEGWWAENIKDSIVLDRETQSKAMKLNFKDTIIDGVNGYWAVRGGELFHTKLGQEPKELYFSYNVKFRPGFEWVLGGKLPGTSGGTKRFHHSSSNGLPSSDQEGYTCSLLFKKGGRLQWYLYYQGRDELFGEAITWDDFQPEGLDYTSNGAVSLDVSEEKWHNITVRVVVNSFINGVPNEDGIMEGFVDGKLVSSIRGLFLLPAVDVDKGVNTIKIGHFFGGGGNEFGPVRDEWTLFDDFVCFTYDESVDVPRGNTPSQPGRVLALPNLKTSEKTDQIPPTVPTGVRSKKKTGTFVDISWEPSQDNTGVAGYRIFLNGHEKSTVETNSFRLEGLQPATTYSISVSAYDSQLNESARSEAVFVTTIEVDTVPPPVPSGLRIVDSTENSVDISWDAFPDTVDFEAYNIYIEGELHGTADINFYSIGDLEAGSNYSISISSFDESLNESGQTSQIWGRTSEVDRIAPSAPEGLVNTEVTENSISLSWRDATDNVSVIGYRIYLNGRMIGNSTTNSYVISGLFPGTDYSISVTAFDYVLNESPHSAEIIVTTISQDNAETPDLPKVKITNLSRNITNNTASVTTEIGTIGHTELIDYGIMISKKGAGQIENKIEFIYPTQDETTLLHSNRVKNGMQLMYDFSEGNGSIIYDKSGTNNSVDLEIINPMATSWLPGQGLKVDDISLISSQKVPTGLLSSIVTSNEITLESWIKTGATDQSGPARIITISEDSDIRVATLGQSGDDDTFNYIARLTTTDTNDNGIPEVASSEQFGGPCLHHVVYTRNKEGAEKIFINGDEKYTGIRKGNISISGGNNYLSLANELSGGRSWIGNYYLVAVYNTALNRNDISMNFKAGAGIIKYSTNLNIEPNEKYDVTPFARTMQGISFGDPVEIDANSFLRETQGDTILMEIYPNPSNGDFRIHIVCNIQDVQFAYLRISDMMGKVVYNERILASEIYGEFPIHSRSVSGGLINSGKELDVRLSSTLNSGVYLTTLILGDKAVGRRLIIQK